jgi:hypothetical protein
MTQSDPTRPGVGHIYDYALGDNHNIARNGADRV